MKTFMPAIELLEDYKIALTAQKEIKHGEEC
jgi:predicted DNA-binding protein